MHKNENEKNGNSDDEWNLIKINKIFITGKKVWRRHMERVWSKAQKNLYKDRWFLRSKTPSELSILCSCEKLESFMCDTNKNVIEIY